MPIGPTLGQIVSKITLFSTIFLNVSKFGLKFKFIYFTVQN